MIPSSSILTLFLIILITLFSILVANLVHIVNVDKDIEERLNNIPNRIKFNLDNKFEHIMWFLQISDLHISIFKDPNRVKEFNDFANETLDIFKPPVVLVSGDLTDARQSNNFGSEQYITEWQMYKKVLDNNNVENKTVWLDIRGNHDFFNVADLNSEMDFFRKYSAQGKKNQKSYLYQTTVNSDKYSFIALDACPQPGLKRPLNFMGILDENEIKRLIKLNKKARENGGQYTIWFGHYPTSCILTPGSNGIRKIISSFNESYAYLNGHLHTLGGIVRNMYTLQKGGFLELELGDWKDNRMLRLAAFDHGLFSIVDFHYNDWPVVLVTNPKDLHLNLPNKENIELQLNSSHIRMLIFSPTKVTLCQCKVDSNEWVNCVQMNGNFFVAPWTPAYYRNGIHDLHVHIQTEDNKIKQITQKFSLDGSRINFGLMGRFMLMIEINTLLKTMFFISVLCCIIPLITLRILHELVIAKKFKRPQMRILCFKRLIRRLWILTTVDRIFIPYILQTLYICIGPWSFTEIVDGHHGFIFVWGIYMDNKIIPGTLTYLYGYIQAMFCQFPLMFIYAHIIKHRYDLFIGEKRKLKSILSNVSFAIIILIEVALTIINWYEFGSITYILGPFRLWTIILHLVLWYLARNLPEKSLRSAMEVWQIQ